jgi:hypothetical protein
VKRIRSFGVLSFGKYFAIFSSLVGFIIGLFFAGLHILTYWLIDTMGGTNWKDENPAMTAYGIGGIVGAILAGPIVYGLLGFIFGIIATAFANVALKLSGGLEIETQD